MKKRILACVMIIATISMLMIGCTSVNGTDETSDRIDNMFVRVGWNSWLDAWIVYNTETKVMYAISDIPYNKGTMTLLVDEMVNQNFGKNKIKDVIDNARREKTNFLRLEIELKYFQQYYRTILISRM